MTAPAHERHKPMRPAPDIGALHCLHCLLIQLSPSDQDLASRPALRPARVFSGTSCTDQRKTDS